MSDDPKGTMELLRATSDQLIIAIAEVGAREQRKRGVKPVDPQFDELARDVRVAAQVVLDLAVQEEITAGQTAGAPSATDMPPIAATQPSKDLAGILFEWRAVEQRLAAVQPGSDEATTLMADFERLRDDYATALKAKQQRS